MGKGAAAPRVHRKAEDQYLAFLSKQWRKVKPYLRPIAIGLLALIALLVIVTLWTAKASERETAVWQALGKALADEEESLVEAFESAGKEADEQDLAPDKRQEHIEEAATRVREKSVTQLSAIAQNLEGADAVAWVLVEKGRRLLERRDDASVAEAVTVLSEVVEEHGGHYVEPFARYLLAKAQFAKADYQQAISTLEKVETCEEDVLHAEARWYLGRCYEKLGQVAKAREKYASLEAAGVVEGESFWPRMAKYRLARLESPD